MGSNEPSVTIPGMSPALLKVRDRYGIERKERREGKEQDRGKKNGLEDENLAVGTQKR